MDAHFGAAASGASGAAGTAKAAALGRREAQAAAQGRRPASAAAAAPRSSCSLAACRHAASPSGSGSSGRPSTAHSSTSNNDKLRPACQHPDQHARAAPGDGCQRAAHGELRHGAAAAVCAAGHSAELWVGSSRRKPGHRGRHCLAAQWASHAAGAGSTGQQPRQQQPWRSVQCAQRGKWGSIQRAERSSSSRGAAAGCRADGGSGGCPRGDC